MLRRTFLLGASIAPALAVAEMAIPLLGGVAGGLNAQAPSAAAEKPRAFESDTVRTIARELAAKAYRPPERALPGDLDGLSYDDYRNLRFDPSKAIWPGRGLPVEMQLFHRGFIFKDRVDIFTVSEGQARRLPYDPALFRFDNGVKTAGAKTDIGYSGFRLHGHLNAPDRLDEIAAFQGASYFRAIGKDQTYGASARGLAIKTGEAEGEEFPVFKAFWVEEPMKGVDSVVVHALLDSPSTSGALKIAIRPGEATLTTVELTLYPRVDIDKAGIGALTSMFLFGPNDRDGYDDFRPAVHDSHGLEIVSGRGDRLWRPLSNPSRLGVSVFSDANPRGFGLMQRQRAFHDYQDLEARYEKRPSVWVEPIGDWGEGAVHLVEIPVKEEIHDNIVAYWRPKQPLRKGSEYRYTYRLHWCWDGPVKPTLATVIGTRVGGSANKRLFVIDFAGGDSARSDAGLRAEVTAGGKPVANPIVQINPETGGTRLVFMMTPEGASEVELRATLLAGDRRASETWLYRWTA
jgi:glucans biosynthesis protein